MPTLVLFDDGGGALAPLTDLRPSFAVRTGALSSRERIERALGVKAAALWVPTRLQHMAVARAGADVVGVWPGQAAATLIVNGRCVLPPLEALRALAKGEALIESESGATIAQVCDDAAINDAPGAWPRAARRVEWTGRCLLHRPWHVKTFRDAALALDLGLLAQAIPTARPEGCIVIGPRGLHIAPSAKVYPGVVFDCEAGPIVIDEHATIRPACTIIGPAYIGKKSTVLDRALIKGQTAIGPECKVAGEIGGTIFQGFANKSHDGHLGDSWIGKWANLGAGTTNSNLLNTYGEVMMRCAPDRPMERTGEQFLGCIVGDHVKCAIATRIMTGTIIGTGAMIAQSAAVTGNVPAFAWRTDETGGGAAAENVPGSPSAARTFRVDKFLAIARTVMARRKLEPSAAYIDAVTALHVRATGPKIDA
ncbi:putative sugar nucleotidyl transferase [soil metagenome]